MVVGPEGEKGIMLRHLLGVVVVFAVVTPSEAAPYVTEVSKDFGSVPKGIELIHSFRFTNTNNSTMTITGVRTSCGCATATISKGELKPGEVASVVVRIDTRKYSGARTFTIYVSVTQPVFQEVLLYASATSRDEITLSPGGLTFGRVTQGSDAKAVLTIERQNMTGWQITGTENENGYIKVELRESRRIGSLVTYELSGNLRNDIPAGHWYHEMLLKSNDPSMPQIRVPITVEVISALTATPVATSFGRVSASPQNQKRVVIRGQKPFKIAQIEGGGGNFEVAHQGDEAKLVHVVTVTLNSSKPGDYQQTFRLVTDQGTRVEFTATGTIVE
jgi:hypothetical protein